MRKGWTRHTLAPVALKVIEKVGEAELEGVYKKHIFFILPPSYFGLFQLCRHTPELP